MSTLDQGVYSKKVLTITPQARCQPTIHLGYTKRRDQKRIYLDFEALVLRMLFIEKLN